MCVCYMCVGGWVRVCESVCAGEEWMALVSDRSLLRPLLLKAEGRALIGTGPVRTTGRVGAGLRYHRDVMEVNI